MRISRFGGIRKFLYYLQINTRSFWKRLFGKGKREESIARWVSVTLEKLYFESQIGRYFLILKTTEGIDSKSIFISLETMEEILFNTIPQKNGVLSRIMTQLKLKPLKIRILQKSNSQNSAHCIVRSFWRNRVVKLSTIEAIQMAHEFHLPIEVSRNVIRASRINMPNDEQIASKMKNNLFSYKFSGMDVYNNNEVVM